MVTEQKLLQKYYDLRDQVYRYLPATKKFLDTVSTLNFATPQSENKEIATTALRDFYSDTKLPGRLDPIKTLLETIHNEYSQLESRVLPGTWSNFVDVNGNLDNFFTEDYFSQASSLSSLYNYLVAISDGIKEETQTLTEKIAKEAGEQKEDLFQAAGKISQDNKDQDKTELSEAEQRQQEIDEIRSAQQESLAEKKAAYAALQRKRLDQLNQLLQGREFRETDLINLQNLGSYSAISGTKIDALLKNYGLIELVGKDNAAAQALMRQYLIEYRGEAKATLLDLGINTDKVLPNEEAVVITSRGEGEYTAVLTFGASNKKLKDLEVSAGDDEKSAIQRARQLRQEFIDSALKPLDKRMQLYIDWGLFTPEELEKPERHGLFEEFLGNPDDENYQLLQERLEDKSLTDLMGVPEDQVQPELPEDISPPSSAAQASPAEAQKTARNAERAKAMGQVAKFITANPVAAAGAAGAGTVAGVGLYGLVTQGVSAAVGGASFAAGGALAGGIAGFLAGGPVGAVVGAIGGGILAGGGSLALQTPSGASLAQIVGQAEINLLSGGAPAVTSSIGTGISPVATQAATQVSASINNLTAGTSSFLQNLASIPLTSATYAGIAVVGPIIAVGAITTLVIAPTILSVFLVPVPEQTSIASAYQGKVCWPTTGYISALETYPKTGEPHGVTTGGSAVDIANPVTQTIIRTPYAGKATTHVNIDSSGKHFGYGVYVTIETGDFKLIFGHLYSFWDGTTNPGVSKQVQAGEFIGKMDNTGASTGTHLHYEVIGKNSSGENLNIRDILPSTPKAEVGARVSGDQCESPSNMDEETNRGECPIPTSFGKTRPALSGSKQYCFEGPNRLGLAAKAYISQLEQGFCNLYNQPLDPQFRQSGRNRLWNESLYQTTQGFYDFSPTSKHISYDDMAWCTSLIINVYAANYRGPGSSMFSANSGFAGVFNMRNGWEKATGNTPVASSTIASLSEIPMGTALFYGNAHVGMVCEKGGTTITSCEANSGATEKVYTLAELKEKVTQLGFPPEGIETQTCYDAPNVDNP